MQLIAGRTGQAYNRRKRRRGAFWEPRFGVSVSIPAGLLDDDPALRPDKHIFVECKSSWFEISDSLPTLTETELAALRQRSRGDTSRGETFAALHLRAMQIGNGALHGVTRGPPSLRDRRRAAAPAAVDLEFGALERSARGERTPPAA
jgi:hypothetical protein